MSGVSERAKAIKIVVKREYDDDPDLSYLDTTPEYHYGKDGYNWNHVSEEDKKKVIEQYDSIWNACIAHAERDKERLDAFFRGAWDMIGITAVATIHIPIDNKTVKVQTISSGGLWGIESDSDEKYLQEIGREQIAEVKGYLKTLCVDGVNDCEIKNEY